jgi:single-stranded-DNA-specific exonuclease
VDSSIIAFSLAPIFNSCGRIDDPNKAVRFLTSPELKMDDFFELLSINRTRKEITQLQFEEIKQEVITKKLFDQKVIVVQGDYHKGIIGILAARITQQFKKPAIVIASCGTGSARSMQGTEDQLETLVGECEEKCERLQVHMEKRNELGEAQHVLSLFLILRLRYFKLTF